MKVRCFEVKHQRHWSKPGLAWKFVFFAEEPFSEIILVRDTNDFVVGQEYELSLEVA
jgi:hypothetical protein